LNRLSQRRGRDSGSNANPENPTNSANQHARQSLGRGERDRDDNEQIRADCADGEIERTLSVASAVAVGDESIGRCRYRGYSCRRGPNDREAGQQGFAAFRTTGRANITSPPSETMTAESKQESDREDQQEQRNQ
jgi:hypothetical protein